MSDSFCLTLIQARHLGDFLCLALIARYTAFCAVCIMVSMLAVVVVFWFFIFNTPFLDSLSVSGIGLPCRGLSVGATLSGCPLFDYSIAGHTLQ